MAASYISVPRDLTKVKSKVMFNLTKRQLICFGMAVLIGVPSFFLMKTVMKTNTAVMGMMVIMMPFFFLAMYEKNGQPLEVILNHMIQAIFKRPKIRPYKTDNYYAVTHWTDFTETIVNQYLLSLPASNRECSRKDLYQFFKFAKRKRCIFTIPITDYRTREMPRVCEALTYQEQRMLYHKIKEDGVSFPYEALLTSLCFLHAVQSMRIKEIKLSAVNVERKVIHMKDVPDIYLMPIEIVLLIEYMQMRKEFPNNESCQVF